MKKRVVSLMLAAACSASLLSGCGGSNSSNSAPAGQETAKQADAQTGEKKKFVVWSRDSEDSPTGRAFASDIAAFQELHPELEIEHLSIPHADVVTKWNTAFAAGTAPDVMDVGVAHIVERVNLGHLIPLDDYLASWEEKDNLVQGMIDYGTFDDRVYALAYNSSPPIMVWRKDYFEAAGLDPNTPPQSWEQMLEYAEKLTEKDGDKVTRAGVELLGQQGSSILFQFFLQNKAETVDWENDVPNFHSQEAIEAAEFLQKLAPYSILTSGGSSTRGEVFEAGNAAMWLNADVAKVKAMIDADPSMADKIGACPSLKQKTNGVHAGAWLYGITSQAKDPDLAWEFIEFIFSEERCRARMEISSIVPPIKSLEDEYIAEDELLNKAQLENLTFSMANPKVTWSAIYEQALHLAYDEIVYGTAEPAQALLDAEQEVERNR